MGRKTTIHNSLLVSPYISGPNLSKNILSFTRMPTSSNSNMEKKETLHLPMIKDNDFM